MLLLSQPALKLVYTATKITIILITTFSGTKVHSPKATSSEEKKSKGPNVIAFESGGKRHEQGRSPNIQVTNKFCKQAPLREIHKAPAYPRVASNLRQCDARGKRTACWTLTSPHLRRPDG